jgi:hypothetical protein
MMEPQSLTPGISAAVITSTTSGMARTASSASAVERPWATGESPSAQCSVPSSSGRSSI